MARLAFGTVRKNKFNLPLTNKMIFKRVGEQIKSLQGRQLSLLLLLASHAGVGAHDNQVLDHFTPYISEWPICKGIIPGSKWDTEYDEQ
ncbi:hypothetical protein BLOT_012621 [Blomia tropicalis]|nr:hypothetical protein BLOT_012621 [Blomia tropicalis]